MNDKPVEPAAAPPKVDPETLVLRAVPGRVTRFRREVIIAAAAIGAIAIVGTAWFALSPPSLSLVAPDDQRPQLAAKAPPELLTDAPASYDDVPQLGPPLPGDLGRPILNHRRERGAAPDDSADEATRRAAEAAAEQQRLEAARRSARESAVMIQLSGSARPEPESPENLEPLDVDGAVGLVTQTPRIALEPVDNPNNRQRKPAFIGRRTASNDINPHQLMPPLSPYMLHAGSIIAASLITGLNSDLPGLVTAQVTQNVYDTVTGHILLIPQGSRLIGSYDNAVAFGQSRALVVWQRILLPDGASIRIDNAPATDMAGYAGLSDRVDRHSWQILKGVALSTLLGIGTELGFGSSESDLVRAVRESAQQSGARAGDELVTRNLDVQPTVRVRPGWPLRVVVHKDLLLRPWIGGR